MALPVAAITAFVQYTLGTPIGGSTITSFIGYQNAILKRTVVDEFITAVNKDSRWGEFFSSEPTIKVIMFGQENTIVKSGISNELNIMYPGFLEKVKNLLATQEQQQTVVAQQQQQQVIVTKKKKNYLIIASIAVLVLLALFYRGKKK